MTIIINSLKYNTADDNALFVKVRKKITINFRNTFNTAIGLRVPAGNSVLRLSDLKIFRGACPHTPIEAHASGARKSFPYQ